MLTAIKMGFYNQLFFLLPLFAAFSCNQPPDTESICVGDIPQEGVVLDNWRIVGPFPSNYAGNYLEEDNLSLFGLSESQVTYGQFKTITKKGLKSKCKVDSCFTNKQWKIEHAPLEYVVDLNKVFNVGSCWGYVGNAYCGCLIECDKTMDVRLHVACDDGEKIWLNNTLLCCEKRCKRMELYEQFLPVRLRKGKNFLLVKVNNARGQWQMCAFLEKASVDVPERQNEFYATKYNHRFLNTSIVQNDTLALNPYLPERDYRIHLLCGTDTIGSRNIGPDFPKWKMNVSFLKDGLYHVVLRFKGGAYRQSFYKGNPIDAMRTLIKELEPYINDSGVGENIKALTFRFERLSGTVYDRSGRDDVYLVWENKMVALYAQIRLLYDNVQNRKDIYEHSSGTTLCPFVSQIDGSIQYYTVHVPKMYDKKIPSAVFITMPTLANYCPYLESRRLENISLLERYDELASKYNLLILEPNGRMLSYNNFNTIDEADVFEAFESLRKRYNIDMERVYLCGPCFGGNVALRLAVKHPDRFAAIGMIAPSPDFFVMGNNWFQNNRPLNFLANLTNTPILVVHSKFDTHISVEASDYLYTLAREYCLKDYTYQRLESERHPFYFDEHLEELLKFFVGKRRNPHPSEIVFSTGQMKYNKSFWLTLNDIQMPLRAEVKARINGNRLSVERKNTNSYTIDLNTLPFDRSRPLIVEDNGKEVFSRIVKGFALTVGKKLPINTLTKNPDVEGPLARLFTQRFILVTGTAGSWKERMALQAISDSINTSWNQHYFCSCIRKRDTEVTEKDVAEAHLVLLGNERSNFLIRKMADKLPLHIDASSISIADRTIKGKNLGFYLVYPNPLNRNKCVGIIGYNNPDFICLAGEDSAETFDITNFGWYDYKVWVTDDYSMPVLKGSFNFWWK